MPSGCRKRADDCQLNRPPKVASQRRRPSPTLTGAIANGYTRALAIDMSGLEGGYDFTLNVSTIGQVLGPQEHGSTGTGVAVDPTGALPLPDAARRQLGIRLEETKRPLPVMVIDSINQTPLDN